MNTIKNLYKSKRVAYMLPGVEKNEGGMYQYFNCWVQHFDHFPEESFFLISSNLKWGTDKNKFGLNVNYSRSKRYLTSTITDLFFRIRIFPLAFKVLKTFIKKNHIEVVHITGITIYADIIVRELLKQKNLKVILTLHDPIAHDEKRHFISSFLKKQSYKKIYKLAQSNANFFIHIHSETLLPVEQEPFLESFVIEQHPLPQTITKRSRPNPPLNPGEGKFILGFFGRIEPYKGINYFYYAMRTIAEKYPQWSEKISITIVGKGDFNDDEWRKLPFECNIQNSFVGEQDFHQTLSDIDLLVLPYVNATQSGVAALGLAYNLPILTTEVGAIPELIANKENCYTINDVEKLGVEIINILEEHQTRRIVEK